MSESEGDDDGTEVTDEEEAPPSFTWSGFMKDNVPQGAGVATYSNGDKFEGTYENSKRSGRGKYTFKNGASYDGMYQDGVKSGFGVMKYPDKSSYEGYWAQDKKNGSGRYKYANGDMYHGEWKDDVKHGFGMYLFEENMSQFEGNWDKGSFVDGQWLMANGDVYQGLVDHDLSCAVPPSVLDLYFSRTQVPQHKFFLKSGHEWKVLNSTWSRA
ncbi:radial spoke head protein 1 [Marchantia polymorpha subsp. ruderalis]|uniref:Radial spoke head 1 homolog n=2 Tax=Marchantia polymorpha TaxID=3197 RepID=A0AAF6BZN7_MARPO|nr:hypothetical protein MARPO_0009s0165 [Marchantia polymorpha]BBN17471.1 hypothetical protein Mp_7g14800 [Marchantia polymorpha subsp. ruderalis]|eukprot:PTQ47077.1 hypothetical protein MARPO_0009s0165 [Marchantia polymorpha]